MLHCDIASSNELAHPGCDLFQFIPYDNILTVFLVLPALIKAYLFLLVHHIPETIEHLEWWLVDIETLSVFLTQGSNSFLPQATRLPVVFVSFSTHDVDMDREDS